jgi:hypothetical protein
MRDSDDILKDLIEHLSKGTCNSVLYRTMAKLRETNEDLKAENKELKELIANAAAEDYYGCYEIIQEYVN